MDMKFDEVPRIHVPTYTVVDRLSSSSSGFSIEIHFFLLRLSCFKSIIIILWFFCRSIKIHCFVLSLFLFQNRKKNWWRGKKILSTHTPDSSSHHSSSSFSSLLTNSIDFFVFMISVALDLNVCKEELHFKEKHVKYMVQTNEREKRWKKRSRWA